MLGFYGDEACDGTTHCKYLSRDWINNGNSSLVHMLHINLDDFPSFAVYEIRCTADIPYEYFDKLEKELKELGFVDGIAGDFHTESYKDGKAKFQFCCEKMTEKMFYKVMSEMFEYNRPPPGVGFIMDNT